MKTTLKNASAHLKIASVKGGVVQFSMRYEQDGDTDTYDVGSAALHTDSFACKAGDILPVNCDISYDGEEVSCDNIRITLTSPAHDYAVPLNEDIVVENIERFRSGEITVYSAVLLMGVDAAHEFQSNGDFDIYEEINDDIHEFFFDSEKELSAFLSACEVTLDGSYSIVIHEDEDLKRFRKALEPSKSGMIP